MFNVRRLLLIVCGFFSSLLPHPFDDTAWLERVKKSNNQGILTHYHNSTVPMPDVSTFPKNFKWGVAIAEFQNSGAKRLPQSNWAHFESHKKLQPSGYAANHWEDYSQDIELMKQLNINSLRFSIDWSVIEPEQGTWNGAAIDRYKKLCHELYQAGITPMATLHHFTHPQWFDDLGGFEKEENIKYFVEFSERVFKEFHEDIRLWCTINEPAIYPMCGYFLGIHSPGKAGQIGLAGVVLKNLLKAHVAVYERIQHVIHAMNLHYEQHEVGIVHNFLEFRSRYLLDPVAQMTASVFTRISNDPVMHALNTNEYTYDPFAVNHMAVSLSSVGVAALSYMLQRSPQESTGEWAKNHWMLLGSAVSAATASTVARFMIKTSTIIERLSSSFDFIGLNYYARTVIGFNRDNIFGPTCFPDQVMGEMDLPVSDPEGYRVAIESLAKLGKPIYLTETGCADANDTCRPRLLRESFAVISQALKNGIDIRGYYHWTLMDNYEWHNAFKPKFGLCDKDRNPRLSAWWLHDFIEQAKRA